jgi:hypothetical protein
MPTEMVVKPRCEAVDAGTEIPALDLDGSSQVSAKAWMLAACAEGRPLNPLR